MPGQGNPLAPGHPERGSHLPKLVLGIPSLSLTMFPFTLGQPGDAMLRPPQAAAGAAGCIAAVVLPSAVTPS